MALQFPSLLPPFLRSFSSKAGLPPEIFSGVRAWLNFLPSVHVVLTCVLFFPYVCRCFCKPPRLFPDPSPSFPVGHYSGFSLSVHDEELFILYPASFLSCSATFVLFPFLCHHWESLKLFVEFLQNVLPFLISDSYFLSSLECALCCGH